VTDVQLEVSHGTALKAAVLVISGTPNERPLTVTDDAPVRMAFCKCAESTGASNVNDATPVPTTLVSVILVEASPRSIASVTQDSVELELQAVVEQISVPMLAVAVKSENAKLRPTTVTDVPPVFATFSIGKDMNGAS
jgi:hypothetical protein